MKKILYFFSVILMLSQTFSTPAYAKDMKYTSSSGHYSVMFTEIWEKIPKDIIEENREFLKEEYGIESPEYNAGFYLKENDYFDLPYIMIQEFNRGGATFEEIISSMENEGYVLNEIDKIKDNLPEFISNISLGEAVIDNENYKLYLTIETDLPTGKTKTLGVMYFGHDIVAHLFFYSSAEEFDENLPKFETIADSFKFEEQYQYNYKPDEIEQVDEKEQDTQENSMDEFIRNFIIYGSVGAVIALIAVIVTKKNKK